MEIDIISTSLIAATLVSLMFLAFGGLAHDAYAVTVITVQDEDSCEALSVSEVPQISTMTYARSLDQQHWKSRPTK